MPELPEVETTRRGLAPHIIGKRIASIAVRQRQLRWAVPRRLEREMAGQRVETLERRGKYLLMGTSAGTALLHLGMSGSYRFVAPDQAPGPHDHVDFSLAGGRVLRYNDPRRFGCVLWTRRDPLRHPLLRDLGPEPLDAAFDAGHLHQAAAGRRVAIKPFIMNGQVVTGVGNIYANEALYRAGIHPKRAAGRTASARLAVLVEHIKAVLTEAIEHGGTTLRDFVAADGQPGYFRVRLDAYDRAGEPCRRCAQPIVVTTLGQRATYYCPGCQR